MAMSRRAFGRFLGVAPWSLSRRAPAQERLAWNDLGASAPVLERRYRADAQVLVLSVPLLRRQGVGGGSVRWIESQNLRLLEFNGYSLPARAAGFNRLGFLRELSRTAGGKSAESIYFGLMTASGEESAEQARSALHSTAKEQAYTVIDGRVGGAGSEAAVAHFTAPSALTAEQQPELMDRSRKALAADAKIAATRGGQELSAGGGGTLGRCGTDANHLRVRGWRVFTIGSRAADAKSTAYFANGGFIPAGGNVIRVAGKLRRQVGGKDIEFRLWVERGPGGPYGSGSSIRPNRTCGSCSKRSRD